MRSFFSSLSSSRDAVFPKFFRLPGVTSSRSSGYESRGRSSSLRPCFYRCFPSVPYRWYIERASKFFKVPPEFPAPVRRPSSFALCRRSFLGDHVKRKKEGDGGRRQKEGKVATRLSRMHNSRPCPWTDGSSEFNDLDAPRPWRKVCIRDHDGEHNRGSKTVPPARELSHSTRWPLFQRAELYALL